MDLPSGCIEFYWLVTLLTGTGQRVTYDGTMPADPRVHTRMSTTRALLRDLKERHGACTVLFLHLEPNAIES